MSESNKNLLVNTIFIAFINILAGSSSKTLNEVKADFKSMNEEVLLSELISEWIDIYREKLDLECVNHQSKDFEENCKLLISSIREGVQQAPQSRYPKSIDSIGKKYFLKSRGSFGYTLNATQDILLLLIGLIVKSNRKHLKYVFNELEDRGLFLDRYSQEQVVIMLDKLNLLDKKSDSGDAQYVKPIF